MKKNQSEGKLRHHHLQALCWGIAAIISALGMCSLLL